MRRVLAVLCLGLITACGTSLGDPQPPTANQTLAAKQLDQTTEQIAALSGDPDSAFLLYGMVAALGVVAVDATASPAALPTSTSPLGLQGSGCVTGSSSSGWVFANCSTGGATINGSVQISETTASISLQIKTVGQANVEVSFNGSVTNTGSRITGDLTYELKYDLSGLSIPGVGNQKTMVTYDLGYSTNPYCINSGSVQIQYEGPSSSGIAKFEYSGCGAFTVRNG